MQSGKPSCFSVRPSLDCDVAVIGGGVAGIAAATRLAETGLRVTMIEKRPFLGGRASSFVDAVTGQVCDVCQHVTLGCCTEFESLLTRLGCRSDLRYLDDIVMQDAAGRRATLRSSALPVPFHLAPSLMRVPWLSWTDRISAAQLVRRLRSQAADADAVSDLDFLAWARRNGATDVVLRGMLEPIIVSACNAGLDDVSAHYGLTVLDRALTQTRDGYRVGIFTKPLGMLFTGPVQAAIERCGGSVWLRRTVAGIERIRSDGYRVALRTGTPVTARALVVAVPWDALPRLIPEEALTVHIRRAARCLRPAAIVSTHHWFDGHLDCPEALALIGRTVHWVFNKSVTFGMDSHGGTYVTTVTSAADDLGGASAGDVLSLARADIAAAASDRVLPPLRHERVFVERKATFIPVPGVDALRPPSRTALPDIAIAGEWTDTGWPSTMESAARSGLAAAAQILTALA